MKCCIALRLIINNLSSLLKGFHTFPKERILPEGIICDSKYLKYSSGSPKGIPRLFCSPTEIHTCVSKDNICSPKGIHRFPKEIFCCPKAIHICVSKDNICSPKGIHRFPKEIFCCPKAIHICVSKDNICSPKGIHLNPKEIFRSPKEIT